MNISVGISSFAPWIRKKVIMIEDAARLCKANGFDAFEPCDRSILSDSSAHLKALSAFFKLTGLKLPCLDIRNDFTLKNLNEWKSNVQHVKRWINVANKMEIPTARIWMGTRSCDSTAIERVHRALDTLLPYAETRSVKLAIENHGGISGNPHVLLETIARFNSNFLGICTDFGNFAQDDRYDGIKMLLAVSLHFHAKAYGFDEYGRENTIKYDRIIPGIKNSKKNTWISIEFEGPVGTIDDNLYGIATTKRLIESCWHI